MRQEQRYDLGKIASRGLAPQRTMDGGLPAAHQARNLKGLAKSHRRQLFESFAIVGFGREAQRARSRLRGRRALEQRCIVALHIPKVGEEDIGKSIAIRKAEEAREFFHALALAWQRLYLLVSDHLQPVLDQA